MDLVKKNILSIIFGVVALIALIAWTWPLGSIKAEAEQELNARAKVYSSMQSILSQQRTMPVTSLDGAEPEPLGMFPTQKVIEWGRDITKRMAAEVQGVKDLAVRLNQRPLLVPYSLPVPQPTMEFRFRDVYLRYLTEFPQLVKAGTPPTQDDVTKAEQELWKSKYEPNIVIRDGVPDPISQQLVTAEFNSERAQLPDRVKMQKARSILFYIQPTALDVSTHFTQQASAGSAPTPPAIWDAQLKVWIQNDIAQAIVDLNSRESKTGSVIDAPVKQLVQIRVENLRGATAVRPGSSSMGMGGMPPGGFGGPPPDYMMGGMGMDMGMGMGSSGPAAPETLTGRTANPLYDVVPFQVTIHIQADKLPDFLEELARNRFITPYQVVSMKSVNNVLLGATTNVVYGTAPVVEAVIAGEALLLRDWTVPLMPQEIKQSLGIDGSTDGSVPTM